MNLSRSWCSKCKFYGKINIHWWILHLSRLIDIRFISNVFTTPKISLDPNSPNYDFKEGMTEGDYQAFEWQVNISLSNPPLCNAEVSLGGCLTQISFPPLFLWNFLSTSLISWPLDLSSPSTVRIRNPVVAASPRVTWLSSNFGIAISKWGRVVYGFPPLLLRVFSVNRGNSVEI